MDSTLFSPRSNNIFGEALNPRGASTIQPSKTPEEFYQDGWVALKKNWRTLALDNFDRAIQGKPNDPRFYYGRSFAREALEYLQDAVEDIDKAISLNSNQPYLFLELSRVVHLYIRRIQLLMKQQRSELTMNQLVTMLDQLVGLEPSLETEMRQSFGFNSSMATPPRSPFSPTLSSQECSFFPSPITPSNPIRKRALSNASFSANAENEPPNRQQTMMSSTPFRTAMLQSQCLTPISNNIPSPRQDALFKAKIDCQNGNPQEITNPLGLKALFVRNVNRNVEAKELLAMFTKYGNVTKFKHFNEKSRSAFVCYDTAEAAVKAVKDLYHFRDQRLCYDPTIAWMFRFAPGDDQCNVQTLKDPQLRRKVVESSGECFDWRVGDACQRSPCPFKHTTINFNIDSKTCESQVKRHR